MLNLQNNQDSQVIALGNSVNLGSPEERKDDFSQANAVTGRNYANLATVANSVSDFTVRVNASVENVMTQVNDELRSVVDKVILCSPCPYPTFSSLE